MWGKELGTTVGIQFGTCITFLNEIQVTEASRLSHRNDKLKQGLPVGVIYEKSFNNKPKKNKKKKRFDSSDEEEEQ